VRPDGVLVVERHGLHALQLRRAGLNVIEPAAGDEEPDRAAVCVVDAVSGTAPDPGVWGRAVDALRADPQLALLVVVPDELPSWLAEFADRATSLTAPISGEALAARVIDEVSGRSAVVDLGLTSERIVDLAGDLDREADEAVAARSADGGAQRAAARVVLAPTRRASRGSVSVPLVLANLDELVSHLLTVLVVVPTVHEVAERMAAALASRLGADVAVLVRDVDATSWGVLGGVGLRPLEWRALADDPPLLALLGERRPILLVRSSDDVRQSAAGLPCASRQHLLVGRCAGTDVVVTVGRDDPALTSTDVRVLGRVLEEVDGLADALVLRDLAVRMQPYGPR
jgi:hypothetical protein